MYPYPSFSKSHSTDLADWQTRELLHNLLVQWISGPLSKVDKEWVNFTVKSSFDKLIHLSLVSTVTFVASLWNGDNVSILFRNSLQIFMQELRFVRIGLLVHVFSPKNWPFTFSFQIYLRLVTQYKLFDFIGTWFRIIKVFSEKAFGHGSKFCVLSVKDEIWIFEICSQKATGHDWRST